MALRALLFSSDGDSTSTLCHVLTGLGIEAEICSEMLIAVERITKGGYDALLVDWDHRTEATFLLKTLRDVKATHALSLALVQNDADLALALQAGANSILRKPIDAQHAADTLSTARDLILSRQAEQKEKEARLAAAQAAHAADSAADHESPEEEAPAPKTGFLPQAASRTALEAEEMTRQEDSSAEPTEPAPVEEPERRIQPAGPASLRVWQARQEGLRAETPTPDPVETRSEEMATLEPRSQDATGVFSSLPEDREPGSDDEPQRGSRFGIIALAACLLVAGVLYVWAPGHSVVSRIKSAVQSMGSRENNSPTTAASTSPQTELSPVAKPVPQPAAAKPLDPAQSDPFPSDDAEAGSIQVIETKAVPRQGAQQPPETTPADTGQAPPPDSVTSPSEALPQPAPTQVAAESHPQSPLQTQIETARLTPTPLQPAPPTQAAPSVSPDPRTGVIIPDSLKQSPAQAPASSLEPPEVPEETSHGLLSHTIDPVYPAQALQQHIEGSVVLQVWIARDGTIRDLKLVRGYFVLGRAAVEAVRQWHFKPYSINGKPTDFQTYITINFKFPS